MPSDTATPMVLVPRSSPAMGLPFAAHSAMEHFRWLARSTPRADGRIDLVGLPRDRIASLFTEAGLDAKAKSLVEVVEKGPFAYLPAFEPLAGSLSRMNSRRISRQPVFM